MILTTFKSTLLVVFIAIGLSEARFLFKRQTSNCPNGCPSGQTCTAVSGNLYTCATSSSGATTAATTSVGMTTTTISGGNCGSNTCPAGQTCGLISGTNLYGCVGATTTAISGGTTTATATSGQCGTGCQNGKLNKINQI